MRDKGRLSGKVAIVTGVSRLQGIGAAICRQMAKEGADLFITYWTGYDKRMPWGVKKEEPSLLQQEIHGWGVRCHSFELDLARTDAAVTLFDEVEHVFGTASILVNNACYSQNDGFEQLDAAGLDAHYAINVRAPVLLSVEFARRFNQKKGGRIISLTSGQSLGPMVGEIAYATTKGAIEAFTLTLSAELMEKGITVNAVNPGPTDTGWMTDQLKEKLQTQFPQGRVGMPEDAARVISFLASDEAEWVTGQVIHSEGGFRRR